MLIPHGHWSVIDFATDEKEHSLIYLFIIQNPLLDMGMWGKNFYPWVWGTGQEGAGDGECGDGVGRFFRAIPIFVVFYWFYSIFTYFYAITGYQKYLVDVLKYLQVHVYLQWIRHWFYFINEECSANRGLHSLLSSPISVNIHFGLSLVDYFPLIQKVHKIAVVSVAIHIFRNNYPSTVDNYFIYSLLNKDFCAVQKKKTKKKKKTSRSKMIFWSIGVPNKEYLHVCPLTKHGPFTDLRANKKSVSVVRE